MIQSTNVKAIHLKIIGKVQGVFFRASTKEKADALGLTGWVKNCDDGSVELFAQGDEERLMEFEQWCKEGPSLARVDTIQITEQEIAKRNDFSITH